MRVPFQRVAGNGARQRDSGRLQAVRVEPVLCGLASCECIFSGLLGMVLGNATLTGFRQ